MSNNAAFGLFCAVLLLAQCTYAGALEVKKGLESLSTSLDRIADATRENQ